MTSIRSEDGAVSQRASELFQQSRLAIFRRTDRLFAGLMVLQWIAAIVSAVWISPRTWAGAYSETHLHVWAAVLLGGLITAFPVCLVLLRPGAALTRHVIAISQMLTSALLIHLSGGRIETHFHVFGSLAFLACYRDWRVLVTATVVVAADHFVRGVFYPQSVFGVLTASPWRAIEHAAWVVFENLFLFVTIVQSTGEMEETAQNLAVLERTKETVEAEVEVRTQLLQEALKESAHRQRRIEAIVNTAVAPIVTISSRGLIKMFNPAAEQLFGYSEAEMLNKNVSRLMPSPYREEHDGYLEHCVRTGRQDVIGVNREVSGQHRDGTVLPLLLSVSRVVIHERGMEADDEGVLFTAVIRDLTAQKKAESELIASKEAAEAASQAKSEFLANMSHEIRTPMTAILGFTDLLLDNVTDTDNIEAVRTVKENGEYLIDLINDILDLSKIEAGKCEVERVVCSPREIVADVASLMRVRATAKGLPLKVSFDGPIPETIQTDPTRVRQILINIVGNAIKFTEVGSVEIVTRLLNTAGEEPKLQFDVKDTGIGIAESNVKKLFTAFTQADSSTTRKYGGTGLGLTISKRLTELLGGQVSVVSTLGEGSTFSITVSTGPLDDVKLVHVAGEGAMEAANETGTAAAAARPAAKESVDTPLDDLRILLAEDGRDNQRLIRFILKNAGAEVTVADNGQIALEFATTAVSRAAPFHVILMDMQMPVLDGYAATRRLRDEGYAGPIIALTAHAMASDRQKCLDAGCDDYATKPVHREKLVDLVASYGKRAKEVEGGTVRNGMDAGPVIVTAERVGELEEELATAEKNSRNSLAVKVRERLR